MSKKSVKIGAIWVNDREINGEKVSLPSIKLGVKGNKSSPKYKPEYDLSVEIIVRDGNGNVVAKQTDGYINLYKPSETAPANLKQELVLKLS